MPANPDVYFMACKVCREFAAISRQGFVFDEYKDNLLGFMEKHIACIGHCPPKKKELNRFIFFIEKQYDFEKRIWLYDRGWNEYKRK